MTHDVRHWHAHPPDQVLERLESSCHGLSTREAADRLAKFGRNELPPPARRGALRRLAAQFDNVLIYVLLAAAGVTALLAHWVDTGVILGVVVINAVIGFLQEGKAERALDAIRGLLAPRALALRDGHRVVVAAAELVPGDVVVLQSGDRVPADLRLLAAKGLRVQEAALTGESEAVGKRAGAVAEDAPLGDRVSMVFSGTLVVQGQGQGVVVGTGADTELGRIGALLAGVEQLETPLVRQLDRFAKQLSAAIVALAALTFAVGFLVHGYGPAEMFLAAVGLAVAAIPEGLPAIVTITLAIGVEGMARRAAIVRRLPAVETLGAVTVICSDKTGTLTCNQMTVETVAVAGATLSVSGAGYDPEGGLSDGQADVTADDLPVLARLARVAVLCNDADLHRADDGGWVMSGDPTEGALVVLARKAGADADDLRRQWRRVDLIPFESEHRFMATLNHDHDGHALILVKGAPEAVLPRCMRQASRDGDDDVDLQAWQRAVDAIAAKGQRALALAERRVAADMVELTHDDVHSGLVLLGVVGIDDPPRPEAIAAVARCHDAGIRVKMITGDHAATAGAIAARMGLASAPVITGTEIDAADDGQLRIMASRAEVFARASPEHKLRLVQALQAEGQVAAMTGDGVNDAPALRRADVGVAMGQGGTEAAKEAAEIVLGDDNFATIALAVEEGRRIYDNIKKAIVFILPTNGGEAFTIVMAILLGRMLPITPVQILWVNMITAVTLALALAFSPAEPDVMGRRPRDPAKPLLTPFLVWRIAYVTVLLVAGTFGLFVWAREAGAGIELARTLAVNVLVAGEAGYLLNMRWLTAPVLNRAGLFGDRIALGAIVVVMAFQVLFTHWGPMQALFDTRDLEPLHWLLVAGFGIGITLAVEAEKLVVRRRRG